MTDLQAEITRTMHSAGCYASDHTINKVMEVVEDAIAVRDGIIARLMPDQGDYGSLHGTHRCWVPAPRVLVVMMLLSHGMVSDVRPVQ